MPLDVDKFAKILGMLGSAHDGERAAAAGRASEMLKAARLSWDDVARGKHLPRSSAPRAPASPPPPPPSANERYAFSRGWFAHDLVEEIDAKCFVQNPLRGFDRSFMDSMRHQVEQWGPRTKLTEKQWVVLERIARQVGVEVTEEACAAR